MRTSGRAGPRTAQTRSLLSSAVVWAAIWMGTAVALKGGGGFESMIPILAVGSGWFLAAEPALFARSDRKGAGSNGK